MPAQPDTELDEYDAKLEAWFNHNNSAFPAAWRNAPLTVRTGWDAYVASKPFPSPPAITRTVYDGLTADEQGAYNRNRRRARHSLPLSRPQQIDGRPPVGPAAKFSQQVQMRVEQRRDNPHGDILGAMLSGPPGTGKTTMLIEEARRYDRSVTREHPDDVPVVNIVAPVTASMSGLAIACARFIGHPIWKVRTRSAERIAYEVFDILREFRVEMLAIDNIDNIYPLYAAGKAATRQIRVIIDDPRFLILGAGNDVETQGPLQDVTSPLASKFTIIDAPAYSVKGPAKAEWIGWLNWLESNLMLLDHEPGTLAGLWSPIHDKTGGIPRVAVRWIMDAANTVTGTDHEALDLATLLTVPTTYAGEIYEAHSLQTRQPRSKTTTPKAAAKKSAARKATAARKAAAATRRTAAAS